MSAKGKYSLTALGESVVVGATEVDGKDAVWTAGEDTYSVIFLQRCMGTSLNSTIIKMLAGSTYRLV